MLAASTGGFIANAMAFLANGGPACSLLPVQSAAAWLAAGGSTVSLLCLLFVESLLNKTLRLEPT